MLTVMPLLFGRLGTAEILIIVVLVLLLFGGKKIPELMRGLGRGVREFKDAVNKDYDAAGEEKPSETDASADRDDDKA